MRIYLKEMGIRPELADEMMRYSSDEAHILTSDEIEFYGLNEINPYVYEQEKSRWIALCGQEWWDVKQDAEKIANDKCGYWNFLEKLKHGGQIVDIKKQQECRRSILEPLYKICGIKLDRY